MTLRGIARVRAYAIPDDVSPADPVDVSNVCTAADAELDTQLFPLGEIRQAGGKMVVAFAAEADVDTSTVVSNMVEITWPPRSGRSILIPEVDEARWFDIPSARKRMLPSQEPLLDRLVDLVNVGGTPTPLLGETG